MHILLFLSRGMSLSAWEANGSLTRELALYEAFAHHGHTISIVTWGDASEYTYEQRFSWLKVYPNRWNLSQERYERLVPLLHAWPLWSCDVVKNNQVNGADLALRAAQIWRKPFVARCGYLWSDFSVRQAPSDLDRIQKMESQIFNGATHCIVTAPAMQKTLVEDYAVPTSNVSIVPNYIPSSFFDPPLPDHAHQQTVATIYQLGRLDEQKNLPSLLRACEGLSVKIRLIGEGGLRIELLELADQLHLDLELLGTVPHEKLPDVLGKADICTLVSHYEGHPKALLEYMARGCAIVATGVPGIDGVAVHERNAILCTPEVSSIRAALERLLMDASLRQKLGQQARIDVSSLALPAIVTQELDIYGHLPHVGRGRSLIGATRKIVRAGYRRFRTRGKNILRSIFHRSEVKFDHPVGYDISSCISTLSNMEFLEEVMGEVDRRIQIETPANALRFLFDLEARLYPLQGKLAVAYDHGIHTKHRHTRYHDFFTSRLKEGENVLDIGCGNGALAFDMAKKGAKITGIDLDADNIKVAQSRFIHPNIHYICGDVLTDLPSGEFDTVVLSNVLEHLPERSAFLRIVQENIRPKRCLIRVPLFERDWRVPLKKELGVEWRLDVTHETEYTVETFAEEIFQSGLSIIYQEIRWSEIWCELIAK